MTLVPTFRGAVPTSETFRVPFQGGQISGVLYQGLRVPFARCSPGYYRRARWAEILVCSISALRRCGCFDPRVMRSRKRASSCSVADGDRARARNRSFGCFDPSCDYAVPSTSTSTKRPPPWDLVPRTAVVQLLIPKRPRCAARASNSCASSKPFSCSAQRCSCSCS